MYGLKKYFHQKSQQTKLHAAVKGADQGCTPLNLNTELPTEIPKWKQEALTETIRRWKQKSLHGRYPPAFAHAIELAVITLKRICILTVSKYIYLYHQYKTILFILLLLYIRDCRMMTRMMMMMMMMMMIQ